MVSRGVQTPPAAAAWHTAGPRLHRAMSTVWIHGGPTAFDQREAVTAQLLCGWPECRPDDGNAHNVGWTCEWEAMVMAVLLRTLSGETNREDVLDYVRRP